MTELSEFGKKRYKNRYANTAAINATKVWNVPITAAEKMSYSPFNHLVIFNRDANCKIQVSLDAIGLGDDTVSSTDKTYYMLKNTAMEIEIKDKVIFRELAIKNLDAANNIAIGDVVVMFSNF